MQRLNSSVRKASSHQKECITDGPQSCINQFYGVNESRRTITTAAKPQSPPQPEPVPLFTSDEYDLLCDEIAELNTRVPVPNGSSNFRRVLDRLYATQCIRRDIPVIQVAGTNGKGSVVCKIAAGIQATLGLKTGVYCSPHLFSIRERVLVEGRSQTKSDYVRAIRMVLQACVEIVEEEREVRRTVDDWVLSASDAVSCKRNSARSSIEALSQTYEPLVSPTLTTEIDALDTDIGVFGSAPCSTYTQAKHMLGTFEIHTLAAMLHFSSADVDVVVLEVGIGGRSDPSNVFDNVLSVITSVGLDHTDLIGSTPEHIAREKSGIIKGAPTLLGSSVPLDAVIAGIEQNIDEFHAAELDLVKDNGMEPALQSTTAVADVFSRLPFHHKYLPDPESPIFHLDSSGVKSIISHLARGSQTRMTPTVEFLPVIPFGDVIPASVTSPQQTSEIVAKLFQPRPSPFALVDWGFGNSKASEWRIPMASTSPSSPTEQTQVSSDWNILKSLTMAMKPYITSVVSYYGDTPSFQLHTPFEDSHFLTRSHEAEVQNIRRRQYELFLAQTAAIERNKAIDEATNAKNTNINATSFNAEDFELENIALAAAAITIFAQVQASPKFRLKFPNCGLRVAKPIEELVVTSTLLGGTFPPCEALTQDSTVTERHFSSSSGENGAENGAENDKETEKSTPITKLPVLVTPNLLSVLRQAGLPCRFQVHKVTTVSRHGLYDLHRGKNIPSTSTSPTTSPSNALVDPKSVHAVTVVLDIAHNPQGIAALMGKIRKDFFLRPMRVLYGCSNDKDATECLRVILSQPRSVAGLYLIQGSSSKRAMPVRTLAISAVRAAFASGLVPRLIYERGFEPIESSLLPTAEEAAKLSAQADPSIKKHHAGRTLDIIIGFTPAEALELSVRYSKRSLLYPGTPTPPSQQLSRAYENMRRLKDAYSTELDALAHGKSVELPSISAELYEELYGSKIMTGSGSAGVSTPADHNDYVLCCGSIFHMRELLYALGETVARDRVDLNENRGYKPFLPAVGDATTTVDINSTSSTGAGAGAGTGTGTENVTWGGLTYVPFKHNHEEQQEKIRLPRPVPSAYTAAFGSAYRIFSQQYVQPKGMAQRKGNQWKAKLPASKYPTIDPPLVYKSPLGPPSLFSPLGSFDPTTSSTLLANPNLLGQYFIPGTNNIRLTPSLPDSQSQPDSEFAYGFAFSNDSSSRSRSGSSSALLAPSFQEQVQDPVAYPSFDPKEDALSMLVPNHLLGGENITHFPHPVAINMRELPPEIRWIPAVERRAMEQNKNSASKK